MPTAPYNPFEGARQLLFKRAAGKIFSGKKLDSYKRMLRLSRRKDGDI